MTNLQMRLSQENLRLPAVRTSDATHRINAKPPPAFFPKRGCKNRDFPLLTSGYLKNRQPIFPAASPKRRLLRDLPAGLTRYPPPVASPIGLTQWPPASSLHQMASTSADGLNQ